MKKIQVNDTSTGNSSTTNTSQAHFSIVFHKDSQDFEFHEGGLMNEEFGMPEDSLMSDLRMIHEGSHREETPQLLFSQGSAEEQEQEDQPAIESHEGGLMNEEFGEDSLMLELRRIHGSHREAEEDQSVTPEASEDIKEDPIPAGSRKLDGLSALWKRILNQFQDFKKNVNMPKAIGRYFMEHYVLFEKTLFAKDPVLFAQLGERLQYLKKWVKASKKNSFKLEHLSEFFGEVAARRQSQLNRLMMRKILQRRLREEIIPNNQVKDKREYLVATKVFGLRCGNAQLAKRMQMR